MGKEQRKVLEYLLDSYERSKTFRGENQVSQSFAVSVGKLFPRYYDDAEYDEFCRINEAMEELRTEGLVTLEYRKKGVLKKIILNPERLDSCYELLGRMPRRLEQEEIAGIWDAVCRAECPDRKDGPDRQDAVMSAEDGSAAEQAESRPPEHVCCKSCGTGERALPYTVEELCQSAVKTCGRNAEADKKLLPLLRYIAAQRIRVEKNLNVEYYQHDLTEYRELLMAVKAVLRNQEEIFIRNFSIQHFHDSKRMEQLKHKAESLLYQYGEYQERDCVLEECGIVHTPTYVMMKGNGKIRIGRSGIGDRKRNAVGAAAYAGKTEHEKENAMPKEQEIDLSLMAGDIALSTESVKSLRDVAVMGKRVVTVENLTSFHEYPAGDDFVIYLGGFHNKVKREFLLYLYQRNPEKEYRHFGDIDAGGFYILEHLKKKTGIPFYSLYMDIETLQRYREDSKPLTRNDRKRLGQLKEELTERVQRGEATEDYEEVIAYMLQEDCKLEQEAVILNASGDPVTAGKTSH